MSMTTNRPAQLALIDQNRQEYGDRYAALSFPSDSAAGSALARRNDLLADLERPRHLQRQRQQTGQPEALPRLPRLPGRELVVSLHHRQLQLPLFLLSHRPGCRRRSGDQQPRLSQGRRLRRLSRPLRLQRSEHQRRRTAPGSGKIAANTCAPFAAASATGSISGCTPTAPCSPPTSPSACATPASTKSASTSAPPATPSTR